MGGFCLLVELHREGSALQPVQQAFFLIFFYRYLSLVVGLKWVEIHREDLLPMELVCIVLLYFLIAFLAALSSSKSLVVCVSVGL